MQSSGYCLMLFHLKQGDRHRRWVLFLSPENNLELRCLSGFLVSLLVLIKSLCLRFFWWFPYRIKFSLLCVTDKTFCDLLVQSHFPPLLPCSLCPSKTEVLIVLGKFVLANFLWFSLHMLFPLVSSLLRLTTYLLYKRLSPSGFPLHFVYILIESNYFIVF